MVSQMHESGQSMKILTEKHSNEKTLRKFSDRPDATSVPHREASPKIWWVSNRLRRAAANRVTYRNPKVLITNNKKRKESSLARYA